VFDVAFNGVTVIEDLDIYGHVEYATAHDEYIPFSIKGMCPHGEVLASSVSQAARSPLTARRRISARPSH
jgi:hypothetical protein